MVEGPLFWAFHASEPSTTAMLNGYGEKTRNELAAESDLFETRPQGEIDGYSFPPLLIIILG